MLVYGRTVALLHDLTRFVPPLTSAWGSILLMLHSSCLHSLGEIYRRARAAAKRQRLLGWL